MREPRIEGIQFSINLFSPVMMRQAQLLDIEQRKEFPDPQRIAQFRGALRAFGDVLGGLRLKREEFAGGKWQERFVQHAEFVEAAQKANETAAMMHRAKPGKYEEALKYLEELERAADGCMMKFALLENGKFPEIESAAPPPPEPESLPQYMN